MSSAVSPVRVGGPVNKEDLQHSFRRYGIFAQIISFYWYLELVQLVLVNSPKFDDIYPKQQTVQLSPCLLYSRHLPANSKQIPLTMTHIYVHTHCIALQNLFNW